MNFEKQKKQKMETEEKKEIMELEFDIESVLGINRQHRSLVQASQQPSFRIVFDENSSSEESLGENEKRYKQIQKEEEDLLTSEEVHDEEFNSIQDLNFLNIHKDNL